MPTMRVFIAEQSVADLQLSAKGENVSSMSAKPGPEIYAIRDRIRTRKITLFSVQIGDIHAANKPPLVFKADD